MKERKISVGTIFIGAVGLPILYSTLLPMLLSAFADYDRFTGKGIEKYLTIQFSIIAVFALIAGFIIGKSSKHKPVLHGVLVGVFATAASLLSIVPVKSLDLKIVGIWTGAVFVPVLIGSLIGNRFR